MMSQVRFDQTKRYSYSTPPNNPGRDLGSAFALTVSTDPKQVENLLLLRDATPLIASRQAVAEAEVRRRDGASCMPELQVGTQKPGAWLDRMFILQPGSIHGPMRATRGDTFVVACNVSSKRLLVKELLLATSSSSRVLKACSMQ